MSGESPTVVTAWPPPLVVPLLVEGRVLVLSMHRMGLFPGVAFTAGALAILLENALRYCELCTNNLYLFSVCHIKLHVTFSCIASSSGFSKSQLLVYL